MGMYGGYGGQSPGYMAPMASTFAAPTTSTYAAPMTSTYAAPMAPAITMPATTVVEPVLPTSASMIATPSYGGYGGYSGASAMDGPFKFHATPQTQTVTQTVAMPTATVTRPAGAVAQQAVRPVETTTRKKKKSSKKKKKKGCCH